MNNLKSKGSFLLNKEQVAIIKKDFNAKKINDKETIEIIKIFQKNTILSLTHTLQLQLVLLKC